MIGLLAETRQNLGKKVRTLRKEGLLPGVLYGPEIESQPIEVDSKEFEKVYGEAGESSLISLKIGKKEFSVLIHEIQKDPISGEPIHVDFYQPILTEEVEASVPLVFEEEAPAVKELGGTLVKEIQEIEVKALPQNLPHEIKVNVESLKTFDDEILVKDLKLPEGVKALKEPNEIVAAVLPPEKVEEELEKPIEEKVEEVEEAEEKEEKEEKEEEKEKKEEEKGEEKTEEKKQKQQ